MKILLLKALLRLTGLFSPEKTKGSRERIKRLMNKIKLTGLSVLVGVSVLCSGCLGTDLFNSSMTRWLYSSEEIRAADATPEIAPYDSSKEQAFLRQSPRMRGFSFPENPPTIKIESYDLHGKIVFSCPEFPNSKLPEHHGSNVITTDGRYTDDHLGSYMYHDSRWNKHYGNDTKQFMVVIFKDDGAILAYSEIVSE